MGTELEIVDLTEGTGHEAVLGKRVHVHYTGWLTNGRKFDSSRDRGTPFAFPLAEVLSFPLPFDLPLPGALPFPLPTEEAPRPLAFPFFGCQ